LRSMDFFLKLLTPLETNPDFSKQKRNRFC
jgi:hypothetical protein